NTSTGRLMRPRFGTLEWGERSSGVLTRTERFHFLRNMAFLATREVTDAIRAKIGLLKPVNLELSDLAPPDTRMVKDAEAYAGAPIRKICCRTPTARTTSARCLLRIMRSNTTGNRILRPRFYTILVSPGPGLRP